VTRGAQPVAEGRPLPGLLHATLWGMGRSIAREHPEFDCRLVDLDPSRPEGEAEALAREVLQPGAEPQIGFHGGRRHVARLRPCRDEPAAPYVFDGRASYLVAGGLRGLGLLAAEWLAGRGARSLILLGRRTPQAEAEARLQALRDAGVRVHVVQADVTDRPGLEEALGRVRSEAPPLKGVIDCAATLRDGAIQGQSAASFREALAPKVIGAWNLHALTRSEPLDWMVLFSSMAGLTGPAGQSNYAAGNAFLDSLAAWRRSRGAPCLSVDWGPWSGAGMAAERGLGERLAGSGIELIEPAEGLRWLDELLLSGRPQVGVAPIDWGKLAAGPASSLDPFFSDLTGDRPAQDAETSELARRLAAAPAKQRYSMLLAIVRKQIAQTIRLASPEELQPDQKLFDIGLDSMMAIEVRSRLQTLIERPLRSTLLFDFPSATALTSHILDEILRLPVSDFSADGGEAAPIESLDEEELARRLAGRLKQIRERRSAYHQ
jgi:NAD(P)-dependent dehydrogenase (short-subunit alcohol dehydrogenase family)